MIAKREGVGMRKRDRRFAHVEQDADPLVAHMRAVDDHAEPVALGDHGAAEGVEAAMARRIGRRVDPVERLVVAGDQHARAGGAPDAQRRQRILEPDAAFDDDVGGNLAGLLCARKIGGAAGGQENVGMRRLDAMDDVDQLECRARGMRGAGRLERRPELRADFSRAHPRDVGVALLAHAREIVGDHIAARLTVLADHPGQIVVAVKHRRARERRTRATERLVSVHAAVLASARRLTSSGLRRLLS